MAKLTPEQLDFLKEEFGISEKDLAGMNRDSWHDIREKCVWIVVDEVGNEGEDDMPSNRFLVAESVTDVTFTMLRQHVAESALVG